MSPLKLDSTGKSSKRGWVHAHSATIVDLFRLVDVGWIFAGLWLACVRMGVPWGESQLLMATIAITQAYIRYLPPVLLGTGFNPWVMAIVIKPGQ